MARRRQGFVFGVGREETVLTTCESVQTKISHSIRGKGVEDD